ncbi:unnamed protein product, partial [Amoebophrya sp. A120]
QAAANGGAPCEAADGAESSLKCPCDKAGYHEDTAAGTCTQNVCKCEHGEEATGTACTSRDA